jgi:hypothetical protein
MGSEKYCFRGPDTGGLSLPHFDLSWNVNSLFAFQTHPFEPQMQAIHRCRDTDLKGGHIKEIGAHKVTFTTHGITHLVVF